MSFITLKMLFGDRAKYLGIVVGLTFASLLTTRLVFSAGTGAGLSGNSPDPRATRGAILVLNALEHIAGKGKLALSQAQAEPSEDIAP